MTPSLEGWPTKAKEAPSPHEVRLAPLYTNPVFQSLGGNSAGEVRAGAQKDIIVNFELIIFSCKHAWMAWVEVTYYGKCDYYALINCIRHFVKGEFIQNYFKIFSFLLIWDKNLGSHTG